MWKVQVYDSIEMKPLGEMEFIVGFRTPSDKGVTNQVARNGDM
jgi:hypothetical protein